ncbi:hypothetical protein MY3296_007233 [Beauveria thailandica]
MHHDPNTDSTVATGNICDECILTTFNLAVYIRLSYRISSNIRRFVSFHATYIPHLQRVSNSDATSPSDVFRVTPMFRT